MSVGYDNSFLRHAHKSVFEVFSKEIIRYMSSMIMNVVNQAQQPPSTSIATLLCSRSSHYM